MLGTSVFAILAPVQASAQVNCDRGVGTEVGFEETLQGTSDTLSGIYDLRATDFGGNIFSGTLVVDGGGTAPLDITTEGGLVQLEFGDIAIAEGACVVADRLAIDRARVTVGAGAVLGGNSGFLATSVFPDGGLGGTDVIGSTVTFTPGSEVLFGSRWNLLGTGTLILDNPDSAVFSHLSGGSASTLELTAGTTVNISAFSGDAGTFEGTLAGAGTIDLSFGFGGTATWTARPSESTFTGTVLVDNYMTLVAEDLGPASLMIGARGRAFVSGALGSLEISDFIGATDPSENVSTLGARLGIDADGSPGRLDVTGDVTLSPLTVLTMNLGAPGGVPGVDSDLITVGGNLTLDGVLLVEDAGGFGFGLYRLFTYGGALTDGSLEVVGIPTGFSILDFDVSTATAGQVNLLVGDQGGGEGPPEISMFPNDVDIWGTDDYDPATTVILAGTGRAIAIDGTVERGPGGIQFANDDFELNPAVGGGSFFLPGTDIEINVGDGTAAGAGFTGTIGADIAGLGGITKTGLGTLVLTGDNNIEGGITLVSGTLQGTTASLNGPIDFGSIDIEQRILSTTVIITGGGAPPLNVTTIKGNYQLVGGVFEVLKDVPIVPDRLVISDSTVTVGSGATFGTGVSPFARGTIFADGGIAETELVDSTVNFLAGSTVNALGEWRLQGDSTLAFGNGPDAGPVIRSLSGGPDSTLEVGTDTTLTFSNARNKGTYSGTLNGGGIINLNGAGTWTLAPSADSAFDGRINVEGGGLDYSGLSGGEQLGALAFSLFVGENAQADVSGGVESIDNEGVLAVQAFDRVVLGITQNLTLRPTSHLQVTLGEPGAANPIIQVGGDLTIDGLFDFRQGSTSSCGTGLYRIIGYGGTLTDNGAAIGETPECFSGTDVSLQTSTPGQVNLLAGSTGGGEGPPEISMFPDNVGTWSTDDYDPATTVILAGEGREIAIDGTVVRGPGGIQFADDDFVLTGSGGPPGTVGTFVLLNPDGTPIRVGDGTAAGAGFTGTIGADITGPDGLIKTDLGTLVLTGMNSFAGDTVIENGTLQVHDTGSLPGDIEILEPGTLLLELTGIDQTLSGSISGQGTTVKTGTGTLTVRQEGESTYTGTVRVDEGTLRFVGSFQSQLSVAGVLLIDEDAFANIFGGGTAVVGEVAIEGGGGLTVGPDTTLQVATLNTAASSTVVIEEDSILDVTEGVLSGELATPDGLFRVSGLVTLAGDTSGFQGVIDILTGGTLTFDQAEDGAFGGTVTGVGPTVKTGDGLLEFFAFDPAYAGGITVAAGTLQVDADNVAGEIAVLPGGTLRFHQTQNGTFTGSVSGGGQTVKTGDGILDFFSFDPAYSGGLSVRAGSFRSQAEGMPGAIDILSPGTLVFNQPTNASYAGTATGTGTIATEGAGTLTLEVNSGWSRVFTLDVREGETRVLVTEPDGSARFETVTIASGAGLAVGPGTTVGAETLTGAGGSKVTLADGSVLVLEAGDSIIDQIDGEGLLEVGGNLTVTGDSPDFTGEIEVDDEASLTINRLIGSGLSGEEANEVYQLNLRFGRADLRGAGIILGEIIAGNGSTTSPGNSIGTLTVGTITFEPGSNLEIEVDAAGNSDLLSVNGAANLNGGIVNVLAENRTDDGSTYGIETEYTILTAGGGVTGTFDEVTENFAFLAAALSYSADAVTLTLTRDGLADFCLGGATANQCATGEGVESLESGALFNAVLVLSETDALAAFDALSGEVHASLRTALLEDSRFPREAAVARLRAALGAVGGATDMPERRVSDRFALWGQGFGAWGNWDAGGSTARLDASTSGFTMGGDAAIGDTLRLGLFGGYSHNSFDIGGRASSGSTDSLHFGIYGGGQWGAFGLRAGGAYAWHDVETARSAAFTGFSDSLSAGYDARTLQVFAEAGYRIEAGAAAVEPFVGAAHVSVRTDGFAEAGGAAALSAARRTIDTTFTTLGMRAQSGIAGSHVRLTGMAGWRHAFGDIVPASLAFAGGDAFAVAGAPVADDAAVFEAGLDVTVGPSATIGLGYAGQLGSGFSDHGIKAHVAVRF